MDELFDFDDDSQVSPEEEAMAFLLLMDDEEEEDDHPFSKREGCLFSVLIAIGMISGIVGTLLTWSAYSLYLFQTASQSFRVVIAQCLLPPILKKSKGYDHHSAKTDSLAIRSIILRSKVESKKAHPLWEVGAEGTKDITDISVSEEPS